jgi:hypothetical protein
MSDNRRKSASAAALWRASLRRGSEGEGSQGVIRGIEAVFVVVAAAEQIEDAISLGDSTADRYGEPLAIDLKRCSL